jgi:hypothetical protein
VKTLLITREEFEALEAQRDRLDRLAQLELELREAREEIAWLNLLLGDVLREGREARTQ